MLLLTAVPFVEVNWLTDPSCSTPLEEFLSIYTAKLVTYITEKIARTAKKDATEMIEPTIGITERTVGLIDATTGPIEVTPETTGAAFETTVQKLDARRVVAEMVRTKLEKTHRIVKAMMWITKTERIPNP
jgi:hypothetical protein